MAQHSSKGARFQAITGNRLSDGEVVYYSGAGLWETDFAQAAILDGPEAVAQNLENATVDGSELEVVGIYPFEVKEEGSAFTPVSVRETIRAKGPTIRKDLGKQAGM
ncbi:MAG: DUF2849 domain-containing protein [Parvibaculales bacterium]